MACSASNAQTKQAKETWRNDTILLEIGRIKVGLGRNTFFKFSRQEFIMTQGKLEMRLSSETFFVWEIPALFLSPLDPIMAEATWKFVKSDHSHTSLNKCLRMIFIKSSLCSNFCTCTFNSCAGKKNQKKPAHLLHEERREGVARVLRNSDWRRMLAATSVLNIAYHSC